MSSRQKKAQSGNPPRISAEFERSIQRKKGFRELLERGAKLNEAIQNDDVNKNLQEIQDIIEKTNKITEEAMKGPIKTAAENVMDAVVIKMAHDLVGEVVSHMEHNQFDEDMFANAILAEVNGGDDQGGQWDRFVSLIKHIDCAARISQAMVGTEAPEAEPKQKKERAVRQKAKEVKMKQPENVERLEKKEKSAQILQYVVTTISSVYQRTRAPIPYYDLILDPSNYMRTVDNAFHIAFLARDGVLAVTTDRSGNLGVTVMSEAEKLAAKKTTDTRQAVMTIAVEDWLEMVERFGDREPLLKMNRDELMSEGEDSGSDDDESD